MDGIDQISMRKLDSKGYISHFSICDQQAEVSRPRRFSMRYAGIRSLKVYKLSIHLLTADNMACQAKSTYFEVPLSLPMILVFDTPV